MKISSKEINRLAFPAIISGIAEPVISLVDTIFVGKLGTEALAGLGIATSFFLLIIWILAQSKTAVSATVSKYYGKEKQQELIRFIPQSLVLVFILGLFVYLLSIIFSKVIFEFYEAKDLVLENCIAYYKIRALGIPIVLSTFVLFGTFRGLQNTAWAMQISINGAGCNIILDYLLIIGVDGLIPSYGVEGAAMASLISQIIMLFLAIIYLYKKTIYGIHHLNLTPHKELNSLIALSSALAMRTISLNVAYMLGLKFATSYSDQHSAAHTIGMNLWLFASFFIDGFANAGNALAGKYLGAGKKDLIYPLGIQLVKIAMGISLILCLFYGILYPFITSFFDAEPKVTAIFNSFFWLIILSQPINAIAFALDGVFKGLGRGKLLMYNLLLSTFLVFCPIIFLLDYLNGYMYAVWLAFIGFMLSRAVHLYYHLRKEYRTIP